MNTFKMKVLLILCNRHLFKAVGSAILVWLSANLAGCLILCAVGFFLLQSPAEFIRGLALSLVFSSPAAVVAAWVLYALRSFSNIFKRSAFSLVTILVTSAIIIWIVAVVFSLEFLAVGRVLYPFTLSAIACFFFIARKQIVSKTIY
jgi:hypothetical protein